MSAGPLVRRLRSDDAVRFRAVRLEGLARHPREFRVAPEDEADRPLEHLAARLEREYVVGGFLDGELQGIGGLARCEGAKLRHKALLWGMYVREAARGTGLADAIVRALLDEARAQAIELVTLTVVVGNVRARRLYERWGFATYGVEPRAVREGGDDLDEALMAVRLA